MRLPYEQVSEVLEELLGLRLAARQIERIVDRQGQRAIARRDAEIEEVWRAPVPVPVGRQPEGPEVLYVEADGAWVNSRERLKMEGKVGLVHQGPVRVGRHRMKLRSAVYVSTFQGSERPGEELYLEADRQGLERAQLVVFLSDGDQALKAVHQTHFYDALCILDWFHLRRSLRRAWQGYEAEHGPGFDRRLYDPQGLVLVRRD